MSATFNLNHEELAGDTRFAKLGGELGSQSTIDSRESFNHYCRRACQLWDQLFPDGLGVTSTYFVDLLQRVDHGGDGVIQTPWGGVVVTLHEHPRVEKYLVVRKGGYLALEMHEEKDELIEVKEGIGILLARPSTTQPLTVLVLAPGDRFHFAPGVEHCIIGTENLLVFERSVDPKGMDQDLIFIYEPDQTS